MEKSVSFTSPSRPGKAINLTIVVLAAFCLAIVFHWIVQKTGHKDVTNLSIAFTLWFIGGIFCGRYISYLSINSHRYIQNGLLVVLPVIIFSMILLTNMIVNKLIVSHNADDHYGPSKILLLFIVFFIMSVSTGMLIKLVRRKIQDQVKAAEARAAHSESELQLLQSQLSPHFLFNTLNNMYGISLSDHEKVPSLLLKLSELLRYAVYDAKELFVPLKDEISYLKNYIEFEKIRIGDRLELSCEIEEVSDKNITIAPMLLIVFVENAFKHSKNTLQPTIKIALSLQVIGSSVLFSVKNPFNQLKNEKGSLHKEGGIGLENVKKRLDLLYKNNYDLKMEDDDGVFTVILRIKAKYGEQD